MVSVVITSTPIRKSALRLETPGSYKLHNLIFHVAAVKDSADNGQGHILGTNPGSGRSCHIYGHHPGHGDVVGLVQQLFYQLRSAFAHGHGAQSAVAGVGIRAQDHLSAAGEHLSGKLMDHGLMRRNIDAAVFLGAAQSEHMVIFIDGAAHGAQRVVAVGEHIGEWGISPVRKPGRSG